MRIEKLTTLVASVLMSLCACGELTKTIGDDGTTVQRGLLGQPCHSEGACNDQLVCVADRCVAGCSFGQDWTCNDVAEVSATWGACNQDGTCTCSLDGLEINPMTGKCRPEGSTLVVGQACTTDGECGTGYVCHDATSGSAWVTGGYCLPANSSGEGPATCNNDDANCPLGTRCSPMPASMIPGVCMLSCVSDAECRAGYTCGIVELFPGEPGSPAGSGEVCWVPTPEPLPDSTKGYELYSWAAGSGDWFFTLLTGTNRPKECNEIVAGASSIIQEDGWVAVTVLGVHAIEAWLDVLPAGEDIFWTGPNDREQSLLPTCGVEMPGGNIVSEIEAHAGSHGLHISVGS